MPGKSLASPLLVIAQMEFAPPSGADRPSFEGKTLLLPGVGIGNIGQLAIDLLVCTATRSRALGALWHDAFEQVLGDQARGVAAGKTARNHAEARTSRSTDISYHADQLRAGSAFPRHAAHGQRGAKEIV